MNDDSMGSIAEDVVSGGVFWMRNIGEVEARIPTTFRARARSLRARSGKHSRCRSEIQPSCAGMGEDNPSLFFPRTLLWKS